MARIPENELENLKREVDLAALVRSKGIELKPHGSKDLVGLSPFTEEKTPSFIVSPGKNLWHCMSSGQGGSVIDFVMKHDGVSFRHAVLLLKEQNPHLFGLRHGSGQGGPLSKATVPKLEAPVSYDADDHTLFKQVLDYYHSRLKESPVALEYLESRGIAGDAIEAFELGFADRTLGLRLPHKNRADGEAVRTRLQKTGLYRETGHEHFNGCIVFPIRDLEGKVSEIYGRRVGKQASKIYHLYLPGPHSGIFNPACLKSPEIILCESVIDALTFWSAGLKHVTCIYGTEGFTDEHEEAFRKHRTQRVYLAYDRDKAGDRAAERDAERLGSLGIECYRIQFPPGMDANEYALKVTPAEKSLRALLTGAAWTPPSLKSSGVAGGNKVSSKNNDNSASSNELAAKLVAKEADEMGSQDEKSSQSETPQEASKGNKEAATVSAEASERRREGEKAVGLELHQVGDDYVMEIADRQYRVRGLLKNTSFEVLKVNLRLWHNERFHLDTLDFYRAKDRGSFINAAAEETGLKQELIKRDLGKVLLKLEAIQEARIREELEPQSPKIEITDDDKKAALELLKSPKLLDRILEDFEACGIVGEGVNKLTGYLAAVSRKLDKPLAIIIQSTSAAGKTSLMEAVLSMIPEEERVKYSAMTGQSLYYLGETNLKNKILAIVEEEGAEKASYALKLLQSEGELTIASTGKDENGRMKTEEYHVEGPVMIFLTTTAIDIDEELLNRCMVLTVDESREQTQAIHRLQREAETFEGLKRNVQRDRILTVHRNAQRLLRPLHVVNPYAPRLTFLSDRTRTRRDHLKYLTLIRTIALLHQYQRPIKEADGLRYIEATLEDIKAANRIAHDVLGRSLDELPPQTRKLLRLLNKMVSEQCEHKGVDADQCLFTRRRVRAFTGWSNTQIKVHLDRLEDFEYILPHRGTRGSSFEYELLFDGDAESGKPQLIGLIDTEKLGETSPENNYDTEFTGLGDEFTGASDKNTAPKRGQNGAFSDSSLVAEASHAEASSLNGYETRENAQGAEKKAVIVS